MKVSKREIWEEIQKDSFLTTLAHKFGCQGAIINGKEWGNVRNTRADDSKAQKVDENAGITRSQG